MIAITGIFLRVCMTFGCYYVPVNHPTLAACFAQGAKEIAGKGTTWTYTCNSMPVMVVSSTGTLPSGVDYLTAK